MVGWEVEFSTLTYYIVKWFPSEWEANRAADQWLAEQHPEVDPKVWVRREKE